MDRVPLYTITDRVTQGSKLAKILGFPTANVCYREAHLSGTYAGEVVVDNAAYNAAVYADPKRELLEAHILDFDQNLYGQEITIRLFEKVAEAKEYPDRELLKEGIANDVAKVRKYFSY